MLPIWGAVATGIWATRSVNPAGADGLLYGNPALLGIQLGAVAITAIYSLAVSLVLLKVVDLLVGLSFRQIEIGEVRPHEIGVFVARVDLLDEVGPG